MLRSLNPAIVPFFAWLLLITYVGSVGCQKQVLRPGAINLTEQNIYDSLRVAQAAINDAKTRVASFPELKAALNSKVIPAYNKAESAGQAYHDALKAGSAPDQSKEQALIAQIDAINAALADVLRGLQKVVTK